MSAAENTPAGRSNPDEGGWQVTAPVSLLAELTHRCPLQCPYCSNPLELDKAGVELVFQRAPDPVWVVGDPTRLAQVVGNVLQNAAKFTSRGGKTTVSAALALSSRGGGSLEVLDGLA